MENKNGITFKMLLNDYFETHHLRADTRWSYEKVTRTLIDFLGKDVLPADISKIHVHQWRQKVLYEQKLSTWTWNNKVRHMRAIFNHGIKTGLFSQDGKTFENPFYKVVVRQEVKRKKILSRKQMTGLYLVMERHEIMEAQGIWKGGRCALMPARFWLTVLDTLGYTGMRQNQLLNLRMGDILRDEDMIVLQARSSKNHNENRVPVTPVLRDRLYPLMDELELRGMKKTDQLFNVSWFLAGRKAAETRMGVYSIRAFFRRLSRECGYAISPHRFRHTIATELMKLPGSNLKLVKDLLGHSSIHTTLEYVNGDIEGIKEALIKYSGKNKK
ncbi:TPA: tyrosine-type recombinase/integrase [Salmonella enterica subsp. diarizonae serovar 61:r:z53]